MTRATNFVREVCAIGVQLVFGAQDTDKSQNSQIVAVQLQESEESGFRPGGLRL